MEDAILAARGMPNSYPRLIHRCSRVVTARPQATKRIMTAGVSQIAKKRTMTVCKVNASLEYPQYGYSSFAMRPIRPNVSPKAMELPAQVAKVIAIILLHPSPVDLCGLVLER